LESRTDLEAIFITIAKGMIKEETEKIQEFS
jgi:hypothetical protein